MHLLPFLPSPTLHKSFKHQSHNQLPRCNFKTLKSSLSPPQPSRRAFLSALSLLPVALLPATPSTSQARCLPERAAKQVLHHPNYPDHWPYTAADFRRFDETSDDQFYASPRITRHIDRAAVDSLRAFYQTTLLPGKSDVLDLCSSVESYMPTNWPSRKSVTGLGMNTVELQQNPALTAYVVRDLNKNPKLPFEDAAFDLVCCAMSIDYLTHPRQIVSEVARVLRKHGTVAFSFSDRVFATKAIALWMSSGDEDHIYTVASYFHYTPSLSNVDVVDLSPRRRGSCAGDPLYVVTARRA